MHVRRRLVLHTQGMTKTTTTTEYHKLSHKFILVCNDEIYVHFVHSATQKERNLRRHSSRCIENIEKLFLSKNLFSKQTLKKI